MLPPPPKRPDPDAFYLEHVPAFFGALLDRVALPPLQLAMQVEIVRATGPLRYVIEIAGTEIRTRAGTATEPEVTVALDMDAFRTATRDLWPRAARRLAQTAPRTRDRLAQMFAGVDGADWLASLIELAGELVLEYTDDAGDTTVTRITVGAGPGARARVVSSDNDATLLLEGKSSLVHLLKSRVTIEGDAGWVLRLATRLRPRAPGTPG